MKNIQGYKLLSHNFEKLQKIGDLVHFEGPLLSLFKDENNTPYIYNWADSNKTYNRWFIFETSFTNLDIYLKGKMNHYDLIKHSKSSVIYIVDLDNNIEYHNVTQIAVKDLPEDYLPDTDVFHEDEDCSHLVEISQFIQKGLEQEKSQKQQKWHQRFPSLKRGFASKIFHKQRELYKQPQLTLIPA